MKQKLTTRRKRITTKTDHGAHIQHNHMKKVEHTQTKLVQILVEETMGYHWEYYDI